jgi:hypothetical protein
LAAGKQLFIEHQRQWLRHGLQIGIVCGRFQEQAFEWVEKGRKHAETGRKWGLTGFRKTPILLKERSSLLVHQRAKVGELNLPTFLFPGWGCR